eukprot:30631-Pelagococcus_subviridis.AAC.1
MNTHHDLLVPSPRGDRERRDAVRVPVARRERGAGDATQRVDAVDVAAPRARVRETSSGAVPAARRDGGGGGGGGDRTAGGAALALERRERARDAARGRRGGEQRRAPVSGGVGRRRRRFDPRRRRRRVTGVAVVASSPRAVAVPQRLHVQLDDAPARGALAPPHRFKDWRSPRDRGRTGTSALARERGAARCSFLLASRPTGVLLLALLCSYCISREEKARDAYCMERSLTTTTTTRGARVRSIRAMISEWS